MKFCCCFCCCCCQRHAVTPIYTITYSYIELNIWNVCTIWFIMWMVSTTTTPPIYTFGIRTRQPVNKTIIILKIRTFCLIQIIEIIYRWHVDLTISYTWAPRAALLRRIHNLSRTNSYTYRHIEYFSIHNNFFQLITISSEVTSEINKVRDTVRIPELLIQWIHSSYWPTSKTNLFFMNIDIHWNLFFFTHNNQWLFCCFFFSWLLVFKCIYRNTLTVLQFIHTIRGYSLHFNLNKVKIIIFVLKKKLYHKETTRKTI